MIERELYMKKIRPFIGSDLVKVITGMRRSGKSVMLDLIKKELLSSGVDESQFISMNFESLELYSLHDAISLNQRIVDLASGIKGKAYIFLDEIQEVDGWEKCINSLRISIDCDIYITGSNARLLSGELATYLGGRYVEIVIYPFSFYEFLELNKSRGFNESIADGFRKYIITGGMPYLANIGFDYEPSRKYLIDLFNSVMLKDIVRHYSIRDVELLDRIIAYMIGNIGQAFSATSLSKFLKNEHRKVAPETILNYIKHCTDAFLFYQVKRQDIQGKQVLSTNEKYYIADIGIREAVFGGNMKDINMVLENIVYMEMLRRGYSITVGRIGDKEIDFIGNKNGSLIYIQVAYLLATEETINREFSSLSLIPDNYPKYVVSLDELDMGRNGIKHRNIRDFLLDPNWT